MSFLALTFVKFTAVKIEIYGCKYTDFMTVNFGKSVKINKTDPWLPPFWLVS
jgi:hypothetical protein